MLQAILYTFLFCSLAALCAVMISRYVVQPMRERSRILILWREDEASFQKMVKLRVQALAGIDAQKVRCLYFTEDQYYGWRFTVGADNNQHPAAILRVDRQWRGLATCMTLTVCGVGSSHQVRSACHIEPIFAELKILLERKSFGYDSAELESFTQSLDRLYGNESISEQ